MWTGDDDIDDDDYDDDDVDRWEAGSWWDDAACYTREEFICEDSTDLLTRAGLNKPIIFG